MKETMDNSETASGWLGILEFAQVSGSIPSGANFGGLIHTELAALALNGPLQVGSEMSPLELVDSWIGYRVFKKNKNSETARCDLREWVR